MAANGPLSLFNYVINTDKDMKGRLPGKNPVSPLVYTGLLACANACGDNKIYCKINSLT